MAGSAQPLPRAPLGGPARIFVAAAVFHRDIADLLVAGAAAEIDAWGAQHEIVEMPGALELPAAIGLADRLGAFDGHVALGCVIRGETSHYDTVCDESARGLGELGLRGLCIGNGILTVENREQALERADPARMDKGGGAAAAALHLVALSRSLAGDAA